MSCAAGPSGLPPASWARRHALLLVGAAPLAAQLVGSAFNIWYNLAHILPMLTDGQKALFAEGILLFNIAVYPTAVSVWAWGLASVRKTVSALREGRDVGPEELMVAQRRIVNFPWWLVATAVPAWLLTIPVLLFALSRSTEPLDPHVFADLPVSVIVAGLMAVTHGMFVAEILSQRLLYPIVFPDGVPNEIPGAYPLSLRGRGVLWTLSAAFCPIVSVLLLAAVSQDRGHGKPELILAVGVLGMLFSAVTSWMMSRLIGEPVDALRVATRQVAAGDLSVRVATLRADEFGPVVNNFNKMVFGLREKQYMLEQFGRHVGREAAAKIMDRDPGLAGTEQNITVMFADLRGFTAWSERTSPRDVVAVLNLFFTEMVAIVEQWHGGMVDKFLGDGFMALFGAGHPDSDHATSAVLAGKAMLEALVPLNARLMADGLITDPNDALKLGVGINTGSAMLGSIGSERRGDYTAIGGTVNLAARVEALNKEVKRNLLLTASTRAALTQDIALEALPPQEVKGVKGTIAVFALAKDVPPSATVDDAPPASGGR